jgi:predicted NAD/FAD-binding protein
LIGRNGERLLAGRVSMSNGLQTKLGDRIHLETDIIGLRRANGGVMVNLKGQGDVWFDKVVMAAHADQSLALIDDASPT